MSLLRSGLCVILVTRKECYLTYFGSVVEFKLIKSKPILMKMDTDQHAHNAIRDLAAPSNPLLGLLLVVLVIIVLLSGSTRAVALAKIRP